MFHGENDPGALETPRDEDQHGNLVELGITKKQKDIVETLDKISLVVKLGSSGYSDFIISFLLDVFS